MQEAQDYKASLAYFMNQCHTEKRKEGRKEGEEGGREKEKDKGGREG